MDSNVVDVVVLGIEVINKTCNLNIFEGFRKMGPIKRMVVKKSMRNFMTDAGMASSAVDDFIQQFFDVVNKKRQPPYSWKLPFSLKKSTRGRNRTGTTLRLLVFETNASTNSATRAFVTGCKHRHSRLIHKNFLVYRFSYLCTNYQTHLCPLNFCSKLSSVSL